MAHRHLILAYALTWVIQLGYVGVIAAKWRSLKRGDGFRAQEGPLR